MKFLKSIKISRFINCICSNSPFSRWGETRMVKKSREMIKGASKAWCTHSLSEIFYNYVFLLNKKILQNRLNLS